MLQVSTHLPTYGDVSFEFHCFMFLKAYNGLKSVLLLTASGPAVYIDKDYNPGVSMWGDLHKTLEYSEGVYQDIVRQRANLVRVWGGEGIVPYVSIFFDGYSLSISIQFPLTETPHAASPTQIPTSILCVRSSTTLENLYTECLILGDFFLPAFSCPFPVTRIGTMGDGGKWVCGFERVIHQQDCVIYSSGLWYHFSAFDRSTNLNP